MSYILSFQLLYNMLGIRKRCTEIYNVKRLRDEGKVEEEEEKVEVFSRPTYDQVSRSSSCRVCEDGCSRAILDLFLT